jgi:hypothetical protein
MDVAGGTRWAGLRQRRKAVFRWWCWWSHMRERMPKGRKCATAPEAVFCTKQKLESRKQKGYEAGGGADELQAGELPPSHDLDVLLMNRTV